MSLRLWHTCVFVFRGVCGMTLSQDHHRYQVAFCFQPYLNKVRFLLLASHVTDPIPGSGESKK